jgi:acetyl-CoA acetyltransferase
MGRAVVAGVAMTKFGKFLDTGLRTLAEEAVAGALRDAGLAPGDVNSIFFANATSGVITRQECIRGQVALRHTGLAGVPVINVENACASGSTALSLAAASIEAGQAEVVLVVGAEKLTSRDKNASFLAFETALDQEELDSLREKFAGGGPRSIFMDIYALGARALMARTGATAADFAKVASKNHDAGALNPRAQYQDRVSEEEVLASRAIVDPLTLLMCSPLGDGAAAMVLVSPAKARALGLTRAVEVRAAVVVSGAGDSDIEPAAVRASRIAYARAAIGPEDVLNSCCTRSWVSVRRAGRCRCCVQVPRRSVAAWWSIRAAGGCPWATRSAPPGWRNWSNSPSSFAAWPARGSARGRASHWRKMAAAMSAATWPPAPSPCWPRSHRSFASRRPSKIAACTLRLLMASPMRNRR